MKEVMLRTVTDKDECRDAVATRRAPGDGRCDLAQGLMTGFLMLSAWRTASNDDETSVKT